MNIRELQSAVEEFIFAGQAHGAGIFDALHERPDTADGLAARLCYNPRAVRALLESLVEMNYLRRRGGTYSVPRGTYRRLVQRNGAGYEGDFWQFMLYLVNPWRTLPHVLKTGMPDKTSYRDFSMEHFIRGMDSPWKKKIAPEIVDICLGLRKNPACVADIGGAPGTMAREFASRGIRTIIYDLAESNDVMREELSAVPNIEVRDGDATKELPAGPYDIAFLGNLCHGQSPEDNAKILRMCRERLSPGGMVAVFDNLRGEYDRAATLALHMLTQSPAGDVYTRKEYFGWLKAAGFRNIRVKALSDPAWKLVVGFKGASKK
jgi:precorrin-6B methylase 2